MYFLHMMRVSSKIIPSAGLYLSNDDNILADE